MTMQREQIWFYYCTLKRFLAKQINSTIRKSSSRAFQCYFFSFRTALVIEKIEFEVFSHIPTGYYIRAATSHYRASRPALGLTFGIVTMRFWPFKAILFAFNQKWRLRNKKLDATNIRKFKGGQSEHFRLATFSFFSLFSKTTIQT